MMDLLDERKQFYHIHSLDNLSLDVIQMFYEAENPLLKCHVLRKWLRNIIVK